MNSLPQIKLFRETMNILQKPLILRIVTFIAASTFLCYEMTLQVALAVVTDPLMETAQLNASHLGWLSACYFLAYTLMQIPAGLLFDRFSCRNVMFLSALCCALGALIFAYFTKNVFAIYLARFLIGAGSAFPFVGLLVVAANCFKEEQFPMFVGITQILAALGALLGSAPLAKLVTNIGWISAMEYMAVIGVICLGLMYFGLHILRNNKPKENKGDVIKSIKIIIQNKKTWKIAAYAFLNWGPMIILSTMWGEKFLIEKLGQSVEEAASIIQFLWIGLSIGSFTIGAIAKTQESQRMFMINCAILGVFSSLAFIYSGISNIYIYFILSTLIGIASAGQILSFSMIKAINTAEIAGTAIGFTNMSVVAGGIVLQPIIGELLDLFWNNVKINGVPHYDINAYKISLAIIPICYCLSILSAKYLMGKKNATRG